MFSRGSQELINVHAERTQHVRSSLSISSGKSSTLLPDLEERRASVSSIEQAVSDSEFDAICTLLSAEDQLFKRIFPQMVNKKTGIPISNHHHRMAPYRNTFKGHTAVKWLLDNIPSITSRKDAIEFGQNLIKHRVIYKVTHHHHTRRQHFKDSKTAFYRFSNMTNLSDSTSEVISKRDRILDDLRTKPLVLDALTTRFRSEIVKQTFSHVKRDNQEVFSGRAGVDFLSTYLDVSREDAVIAGQALMDLYLFKGVARRRGREVPHEFCDSKKAYFEFVDKAQYELERTMATEQVKYVGELMSKNGWKPKYPVIIVPGLASSSLEVWESAEKPDWETERLWIDISKIGKAAKMKQVDKKLKRIKGALSRSKSGSGTLGTEDTPENSDAEDSSESSSSIRSASNVSLKKVLKEGTGLDEFGSERAAVLGRQWLHHMMPLDDGWSDPPGIKVRAVEGLHGVDTLIGHGIGKSSSYVQSKVIRNLKALGYDSRNLLAAPYDWRIPPAKLEERDSYFTRLKGMVETAFAANNEQVVLYGHSMGNRTVGYFLQWVKQDHGGQEWIDKYIGAFLAVGAPWLGSTKVFRGLISGDPMGMDIFLMMEESIVMGHNMASLPWLRPLRLDLHCDECVRVRAKSEKTYELRGDELMATEFPRAMGWWDNFYVGDKYFGGGQKDESAMPVMEAPPVKHLWCVYGINLPTETSYYYAVDDTTSFNRPVLDEAADKYSEVTHEEINPVGLRIEGGIGYETSETWQRGYAVSASGDKTVPYCSLAYAKVWQKKYGEERDIRVTEIEGADHRHMLRMPLVIKTLLEHVAEPPSEEELKKRKIQRAFDRFDIDGSGAIDKEELAMALGTLRIATDETLVDKIMDQFDEDGDGEVTLDEFESFLMSSDAFNETFFQ